MSTAFEKFARKEFFQSVSVDIFPWFWYDTIQITGGDRMPYCTHCGKPIDEGTMCDTCQRKTETDPAWRIREEMRSVKDHTADFDPIDIQNNTGISILSYLGLFFLIPYFARQDSPYARFHARQGLVLFLFELVVGLAFRIALAILGHPTFLLPRMLRALQDLLGIAFFALSIVGWVNLSHKQAKELPFIGRFAPKDRK